MDTDTDCDPRPDFKHLCSSVVYPWLFFLLLPSAISVPSVAYFLLAFGLAALGPGWTSSARATDAPIQDNSFLIEEAYNQEAGVIQHISTFERDLETHDWLYAFTQEWRPW